MSDLTKLKAKVKDWGLTTVGAQMKDVIKVTFEAEDGKEYVYTGWLDTESLERTVKTLATCGLSEWNPDSLGEGIAGGALAVGREVRITLKTKQGNAGRSFTHVQYVDPLTTGDKFEKAYDKRAQTERLKKAAPLVNSFGVLKQSQYKSPTADSDDMPF